MAKSIEDESSIIIRLCTHAITMHLELTIYIGFCLIDYGYLASCIIDMVACVIDIAACNFHLAACIIDIAVCFIVRIYDILIDNSNFEC